ncbi:hypothetical protein CQA49_09360 [Helicobacter sp. MIT 00-7814]|uniref:hypothetical protein n=1 Tax=unclassified Helicobacter TaxID=2593540 RepID=UPI000E1F4A31|nr:MULTISPECIES: hypothetical protein [unclassified Helicobacter]RDU51630.1 hypothetical protein CQA49_09360 [Helicobacter sp. MIT 00-7814]RDU51680.1 hypothetical protein CQA37_09470 [Helicobacter sp. MIT 99-10781]
MDQQIEQQQPSPPNPSEQLGILEGEINDALNAFENNFVSAITQKVNESPELEELFFENREEFFKQVISFQNEFLSGIKEKMGQANTLRGEIQASELSAQKEQALEAFLQNHPDIDKDELLSFFESLPQEVKDELESLPVQYFYEALLNLFNNKEEVFKQLGQEQEGAEQGTQLPEQLSGVAGNAELGADTNLPMTRQ